MPTILKNYVCGEWQAAETGLVDIASAIDGHVVARASTEGIDFAGAVAHAREIGGPALRRLTFHERADALEALATYITTRKETLYERAYDTGSTKRDSALDIDGGIAVLLASVARGRRDLPDSPFVLDGPVERLSPDGSVVGLHVMSPLEGVAVQVNAFSFPVWSLLAKLAPAILAGVPVIVKAATVTAQVAEALAGLIVASGVLPRGAFQFVAGSMGDLLDHLTGQDVVACTGSTEMSDRLRDHPVVLEKAVRVIATRDSLNAAILGPDAIEGTPEFDLFVHEVAKDMTAKAGQKGTAIRRVIVPRDSAGDVAGHIAALLGKITLGDPRADATGMGPLVSREQRESVRRAVEDLVSEADIVFGDPEHDHSPGAYFAPVLLRARQSATATKVHTIEPFGPVATILTYETLEEAIALVVKGEGGLVASLYTYDDSVAAELVSGVAAYHGRLVVIDRDCAAESIGHGAPVPALVHGGPGRAGGGEELGGLRGVFSYMQRTALQGSPARLSRLTGAWIKGAPVHTAEVHPFRRHFDDLLLGQTIETAERVITLADIEQFAHFTGDTFYAHMDEAAASAHPFFPGRVAHGYLVLSFAAGLFVDPAPGPLLANYGLESLRFLKPVSPGDAIRARVTVKSKRPARQADHGEVRWDVEIANQHGDTVARYDLLTLSARR